MEISKEVKERNEAAAKVIADIENSPGFPRAQNNASEARKLLIKLRETARENGQSQEMIAETLGWSVENVKNFEAMEAAPQLPHITRYAHAAGAWLHFDVSNDGGVGLSNKAQDDSMKHPEV